MNFSLATEVKQRRAGTLEVFVSLWHICKSKGLIISYLDDSYKLKSLNVWKGHRVYREVG